MNPGILTKKKHDIVHDINNINIIFLSGCDFEKLLTT